MYYCSSTSPFRHPLPSIEEWSNIANKRQGMSFFTPTVVRSLYPTRSVVTQQLYSVPPFVAGSFFTLVFCYLAWKLGRRNIIMIVGSFISLIVFGIFLGSSTKQTSLRYAATFIRAAGSFAFGALCNAQVSANVVSDTARSSVSTLPVVPPQLY